VFTSEQYRAKAAEYTELSKQGNTPDQVREFQAHERSLTMLADNKQWLDDNDDKLANNLDELVPVPKHSGASDAPLAAEEEHVLQCLGSAVIMRWNTLPIQLQRELFDHAGSMGETVGHRRTEGTNRSLPAQVLAWRGRDHNIVTPILTDIIDS
jgi:hypothetical protein